MSGDSEFSNESVLRRGTGFPRKIPCVPAGLHPNWPCWPCKYNVHPALSVENLTAVMKSPFKPFRFKGFALVITLSLMVLLTVIAVGLLSLAAISLNTATQGQAMATARSNARLALMLAIGDLQKSLGPDRAISAPSGVLAASPAKPNAIGVWESWWDFNPNSGSLSYGEEKSRRFRRWLVSNADPAAAEDHDFATAAWSGQTIELVGNNALGGKADATAKVVAGKVPVARDGKTEGAFAWHVADESLKARINLYRDPSQNTTIAQKRALLAGQRPDPSVMKSPDGTLLTCLPTDEDAGAFTKADKTTGKVVDLDEVDLLDQAKGKIKPFRNDVTPYSLGLLTDVRGGGLKQDLSSIFELDTNLPTEFAGTQLYKSTHGITGVSDPYWSTLSGYYNIFRKITTPETHPTVYQAPPNDVTLTTLAPPTSFNPGPVIAKIEVLFNFVVRDAHANWVGSLHAVDPALSYMGHLVYTPLVTLHNPYNVSISFDTMEVLFRNIPLAFRFYVNGKAQNTCLVPICEMYVNAGQRGEKSFSLKIGNWASPTSTTPSGPVVMTPGQTLVCAPFIDPNASFSSGGFFDYQNNLTGAVVNNNVATFSSINAKPGFFGRCIGFDIDWLTPTHSVAALGGALTDPSLSNDSNMGICGLRATDTVYMEYAVRQPTLGPNTSFDVTAKLTVNNTVRNYGGLSFYYKDNPTLQGVLPQTYRYPLSGDLAASTMYVPNTEPISQHAAAKSVAIFSAYGRTTNGGVYETNKRTQAGGAVNSLRDGRLAGKPFLFHNPARTVMTMDFTKNKPASQSHELNFQWLPGNVEDFLEINGNRVDYLTGNTAIKGIKSGSYLELPTGPLETIADFRRSNALTSSYLPNFVQPVANSSVHPLMSTGKVVQKDPTVSDTDLLDHSVLANLALYDRFYFSTFATRGSDTPDMVFEQFMKGNNPLPLQAFQPHLPAGKSVSDAKGELFTSGKPTPTAYKTAAEYQMIRGPFNVNSTSVQAWKAVLGTMNKDQIVTLWEKTAALETTQAKAVPILGMSLPNGGVLGGSADANKIDDSKTNEWNGHRELSNDELETLATKIVDEVRNRGPFLSLAEFVNRQVGPESALTLTGALDAAITQSKINDKYFTNQVPITAADLANPALYGFKTPAASCGNPAAGAPGWISQGDLMRILEPAATVRGDTFVIRVCGEAWDTNGKVTARAYAEAVVQRMPEYVDPVDRPSVSAYGADSQSAKTNKTFGRRMNLVSFRWLDSNEI